MWLLSLAQDSWEWVWVLMKKFFFRPSPSKGRPTKYHYTKLERLNLSGKVMWDWSVRDNLCSWKIMILTTMTETYAMYSGPRPPPGLPGLSNKYQLPPSPHPLPISTAWASLICYNCSYQWLAEYLHLLSQRCTMVVWRR